MNETVSFVVVAWAAAAATWALGKAVMGIRTSPPALSTAALGISVFAWIATGLVAWSMGSPPARPLVFVGYALVAVILLPIGVSVTGRFDGRWADLARATVLGLLAFLCYRAEAVWLVAR